MSDLAKDPACRSEGTLARWNENFRPVHSPILRYGFSALCVVIALGLGADIAILPVPRRRAAGFALAIALVTWYAGRGPSVLAILLASGVLQLFPLRSLSTRLRLP